MYRPTSKLILCHTKVLETMETYLRFIRLMLNIKEDNHDDSDGRY